MLTSLTILAALTLVVFIVIFVALANDDFAERYTSKKEGK
jgi:hypothetical protein